MASNNITKDQVLTLFPDNLNNEITAEDMRLYVEAVFGDKEVIINKLKFLSDLVSTNANIYEGSLVVVYGDIPENIGLYISKQNQPTLSTDLIQLSKITGSSGGTIDERGGLLFSATKAYYVGDMASFDEGSGLKAYICIANTAQAPFDPLQWQVISGGSVVTVQGTLDRDFGKLSAGTDVSGLTLTEMIEQGYIGEIISTITISSPNNIVLEKGNTQTNVTINSNTVLGTGTLIKREYLVNNIIVDTNNSPAVGADSFVVASVADTTSFKARITDTIGVDDSNTRTYTFVYPYYFGVDVVGASDVVNLTKDIITSNNNLTKAFTSNNNVFYFCYLKSYGDLISILDENGFETLGDWTRRDVQVTGLDSSNQTYSFYEFNNITTTSTQFTFKR